MTHRLFGNAAAVLARTLTGVGLAMFASRWSYLGLGPADLGTVTAVIALVGLLGLLTGAMSQSSQRFMALATGRRDEELLCLQFSAITGLHLALAALALFVGVAFGPWFIDTVLQIPVGREAAARVVYRCLLIQAILGVLAVPSLALLAANQRLVVVSTLEIVPAIASAAIAYSVRFVTMDRLTFYVAGTTAVSILGIAAQVYVSRAAFPRVRVRARSLFDWEAARGLLAFSGWNLFGITGSILSRQGSSLLVNGFAGPMATASYGLAAQASNQAASLTSGLVRASFPEIVAREGRGERTESLRLAMDVTRYSTLLTLLWWIPLFSQVENVLRIWLTTVPADAAPFLRLLLLVVLFDNLSVGFPLVVQSIGRLGRYQVSIGALVALAFPISLVALRSGAPVAVVPGVVATITFVQMLVRVFWASRLAGLRPGEWAREVIMRSTLAFLPAAAWAIAVAQMGLTTWPSVIVSVTGCMALAAVGVLSAGITGAERRSLREAISRGG